MPSLYSESLRAFLKPVVPYLDDESVSEILINGPEDVWIERKGRLHRTDATFSEEGLLGAARNMAQFVGRVLSEERPRLDARLPDGSRIHVVLPPIARRGCTISIRKFFKDKLTVDALLEFGSLTPPMARLIEAAILTKQNVIVSGGTGSGKTTLLNIVSSLIPDDERILTIEDSAELQLHQTHLVAFESRPPDKLGKGGVDMGELLHSALRLRPDRIVVGEVRGGEAFHLMQAMNTGHGGSLATTHANTPTDTLRRIESLCLMSGVELPMVAVRAQVASAINLIICCERLHDGARKVTAISEVLPLNDKGDYRTQDLFVFTPLARGDDGEVLGYHAPTGIVPGFVSRARAYGFADLTDAFFDPETYGVPPPPLFHAGAEHAVRWAPSLRHRAAGLPDPDPSAEFAALEQRLRQEARARSSGTKPPPPARSIAPARPSAATGHGASPAARPAARSPLEDDDRTPLPGPVPLDGPAAEPLVQVDEELLAEAQDATRVNVPPARPAAATLRNPSGNVVRESPPAPSRPVRAVPARTDDEKTHLRPMPDRPRRP